MMVIYRRDNISDGMMTRETDMLADVVMNALWFSDKYMPTEASGNRSEELNPGKLARECVNLFLLLLIDVLLTIFAIPFLHCPSFSFLIFSASGHAASLTVDRVYKNDSRRRLSFSSKPLMCRPKLATRVLFLISSLTLMFDETPQVYKFALQSSFHEV